MKGKGVKDVKQWVLKRTKSAIEQKPNESHEKGNDGPSRPEEERGQTNQALADSGMKGRMDICSPVSAISASIPQKTTFSAKGTEFRVDPRYSLIKPLGLGAYGVVCSANDSKENRKVAIKKVAAVFDDQTDAKRIIREIRLLSSMSHDNILCITDIDEPESYISFNEVYIMTELMDTDLNKLLRSKHPLLEAQRKFFTYQILRALKYIHSASILHRDLKPANVLVSESCDLKICDFGLARYVDTGDGPQQAMTEYVVTRWYRAPELLLAGDEYTAAIDMWSAGCLIAELYSRKPIFPGRDVKNQIEVICQVLGNPTKEQIKGISNRRAREFIANLPQSKPEDLATIMPEATPEVIDLVQKLLKFDANERLSAAKALEHPYVAEFRDEETEIDADPSLRLDNLEPPNEKTLGRDGVRRLMWDEILKFHPSAREREPPAAALAEKKLEAIARGSAAMGS